MANNEGIDISPMLNDVNRVFTYTFAKFIKSYY